jgi:hypothetical protein
MSTLNDTCYLRIQFYVPFLAHFSYFVKIKGGLWDHLLVWVFVCISPSFLKVRFRVSVTLWLAVYRQSVRLGDKPLETHDQYFFFQLNICGHSPYVTSSLTRGWVCSLQLLLALSSAVILRSESLGTHHILLSQIRDSPNLEGQVPAFISPRNRVTKLYPQALVFFHCLLRLSRLRWRYSSPPPHGVDFMYLFLKAGICSVCTNSEWTAERTLPPTVPLAYQTEIGD